MNLLEPYHQTCTYDTGNNLTHLSHQANSSTWQQTLAIHPSNNRGTETQQSTTDFDANGNLLTLDNIGALDWHYNNTLNQLTKADKNNTAQYYVYDYQGKRVRTVVESNNQVQSLRDYLPALDISTKQAKQQTNTLHIGTHILSESSKDNTQTRYQLNSHLQSNTLELNDKAQTLSYEHYYPYGGTAIIAGKDKTKVQQKRYRYTCKERDDNSGLSYYGARYLAPWLTRWISPDSVGAVDGLNLYAYVGNNPLKYVDPTGHVKRKNTDEGAVGGANNIQTGRPDSEKYIKIDETVSSLDLKIEKIKAMQQEILQSDVFKKLGALKSSTRLRNAGTPCAESNKKILQLRNEFMSVKENPSIEALIKFNMSDKFKELVLDKYQVANCSECANVMFNELSKNYPAMTVEHLTTENSDHSFNLINRNQSTPIFEPEKWNEDSLVVDAWAGVVYTKKEFISVNLKLKHYGLDKSIEGSSEHIIKNTDGRINLHILEGFNVMEKIDMPP
ncbi:RHS repeat domain-containing protein [thiotrophic endosymbiont of Bathymodiolus puteoserpentis (Logatchev)]|jgi:RHS repeat-associated protein|uniref:RHS repeat domain-containing protein n=1 Tax=thiotrophic endosymbiont of Bathymodiolus puteoserpentis (Logatchev) TaxID=343240 RepID=UPI0010B48271|nr:RHS repeat-associated core domain-containing protein [thiotrophic endosymbiont of Bathymodiolus puteoserpentis (Logatchev)]CAC9635191.1 Putative insecticidal toxin complex [uncultured Gammaproteobacteria bacterium]CAC9659918.1 Putative insecticidal toxin complex [uncultured Gammaproteobacteria bacterium]SSC10636.1 Putative insecticidal toxin complex [thiotrophic endosymbiont of Bathymodiolus puteoserpentis (Logatchev)]